MPDFRHSVWGYPQDEMNADFQFAVQRIPHDINFILKVDTAHRVAAATIKHLDQQIAFLDAQQRALRAQDEHDQVVAECESQRVWPPCK